MFCSTCGKKIDDDSRFCEFCGAQLPNGSQMPQGQSVQPAKKSSGKTWAICISVIAAVLVLSISIPLSLKSNPPANSGNYADIVTDSSVKAGNTENNGDTDNNGNTENNGDTGDTGNTDSAMGNTPQDAMRLNGKNITFDLLLMNGYDDKYVAAFYGKSGSEIYEVGVTFESEPVSGETYSGGVTVTCNTADASGNVTGQYTLTGCTVSVTAYQSGAYIDIEANCSDDVQLYLSARANYDIDADNKVWEWLVANISSPDVNNGGTENYQPMKCYYCSSRGVGKCRSCNGDGSCHMCVDGMSHCLSCLGSRICQKCGGSGICPYCGGDGIIYN